MRESVDVVEILNPERIVQVIDLGIVRREPWILFNPSSKPRYERVCRNRVRKNESDEGYSE
jgi:hypothetical protein